MARVTVEDCVVRVPNRFELVMMAAQRSREVTSGAPLTVDRDNDKNPVVALREIADGTISLEHVRDALIRGRQRHVEMEEPEEEVIELMAGEEDWLRQGLGEPGEGDTRPAGDPFESLDETELAGFADEELGLSRGDEQPVIEEPEPAPEEAEAAGAEDADLPEADLREADLPEINEDVAEGLDETADEAVDETADEAVDETADETAAAADVGEDADETDDPTR